jgi:hypothetical protein
VEKGVVAKLRVLQYLKGIFLMRGVVQAAIIGLSALIIVDGDFIWEFFWPKKYWSLKVTELEKCVKKDLWNLKSIEWEVMKARIELSIAVSAAGDRAECLGGDSALCILKAKERASIQLRNLMGEEMAAKAAYAMTLTLFDQAKNRLSRLQNGS